ncbi:MAG: sigma-70 family RNA polymerase sigma factor [Clostridia bacterium]|nr:sigma-70 family RNA polymerase sigma factor [Clostridia bacterium]
MVDPIRPFSNETEPLQAASSHFSGMSDEVLVHLAQNGNTFAEEELVNRYTPTVYSFTRNCYRDGWERSDFVQEGMFGLIQAIREFDDQKQVPFSAYAALCIRSELLSALRKALSSKHVPLTGYISLSPSESGMGIHELLSEDTEQMFDRILTSDEIDSLLAALQKTLSPLEKKVLSAYLKGFGIGEIACALRRSDKSAENALTRIRRKASTIYRANLLA